MKRTRFLAALVAILILSALAWKTFEHKAYHALLDTLLAHSVPEVSVEDASALEAPVFLDTREEKEFAVSHLPNSRWVGYSDFTVDRLADIPKDQPLVVYCSIGYRSEKVCEQLQDAGYMNVQNLTGGLFEWKNSGHSVVDENGPTEQVHAYSRVWGIWLHSGEKVYD